MASGAAVFASCGGDSRGGSGCPSCKTGKPCGCSCISKSDTCHKADDGAEWTEAEFLTEDEVFE